MKWKRIPVLKLNANNPSFLPGNFQNDFANELLHSNKEDTSGHCK